MKATNPLMVKARAYARGQGVSDVAWNAAFAAFWRPNTEDTVELAMRIQDAIDSAFTDQRWSLKERSAEAKP